MSTIILVEYKLDFWINLVYLTLLTSMLDQTCMVDIFLSNLRNYNYSYNLQLQSSCHNTYIIQVACWHIFIACRSTYIKHRENVIIIMLFLSSCSVHGNFTCNSSYKKASPMHPTLIHRNSYITLSYPECEFLGQAILIEDGCHLVHNMVPLHRKIYT